MDSFVKEAIEKQLPWLLISHVSGAEAKGKLRFLKNGINVDITCKFEKGVEESGPAIHIWSIAFRSFMGSQYVINWELNALPDSPFSYVFSMPEDPDKLALNASSISRILARVRELYGAEFRSILDKSLGWNTALDFRNELITETYLLDRARKYLGHGEPGLIRQEKSSFGRNYSSRIGGERNVILWQFDKVVFNAKLPDGLDLDNFRAWVNDYLPDHVFAIDRRDPARKLIFQIADGKVRSDYFSGILLLREPYYAVYIDDSLSNIHVDRRLKTSKLPNYFSGGLKTCTLEVMEFVGNLDDQPLFRAAESLREINLPLAQMLLEFEQAKASGKVSDIFDLVDIVLKIKGEFI